MITTTNHTLIRSFGLLTIIILTILAYQTTLEWMIDRYMGEDSYYSHGPIIPLVSLFLIYQKRDILEKISLQPNFVGLFIFLFALLLHILGTILYIFSISGFSLYFLIIGLALFLLGKEKFKTVAFPIIFLIFMFPLPGAILTMVSFPLKIIAANAGVWTVSLSGIPIHIEGFNIAIPAGQLLVGNPCSGLRSLIAFLALGFLLAYITPLKLHNKFALIVLTIPIALISNIIRVAILISVSHYWGLEAATPDTIVHSGSGVLVFVLGFSLLLLTSKVLK